MKFIKLLVLLTVLIITETICIYGNSFSDLLINQNYPSYLKSVNTLGNEEKLLLKSVYFTQYMIDYYNDQFEDSLIKIVKEADTMTPENDTGYFIKGGIYLNYAFYLQFKSNMWGALNYGNKGIKYLKKVSKNSALYNDALLGVAIYDYGMGKLFFNKNRIKKGLKELEHVSQKGNYFGVIAQNLRILLLYNEKKYNEGLKESFDLLSKYPDSRLVLWDVIKGLRYKSKYDSLIIYGKMLTNNIRKDSIPNKYNLLTVYNWQIDAYIKLNKFDSARNMLDTVVATNVYNCYIRDVTKLKKDIVNRYSSLLK